MQINNNTFWNKFYKRKISLNKPSSFAIFISKFLKDKKLQIVDVGCGNGRDIFKLNFKE